MSGVFHPLDNIAHASPGAIGVVPLGATEFHGPHLGRDTDWQLARGICERLQAWCAGNPNAPETVFLEPERIGYSPENMRGETRSASKEEIDGYLRPVAGLAPAVLSDGTTLSLSHGDAIGRWIAIGEGLYSKGFRKLLFLNAHGGNSPLVAIVVQELRVRFDDLLAVNTKWDRFLGADQRDSLDIHGGRTETSALMALGHDVDRLAAGNFGSAQETLSGKCRHLRFHGSHSLGWKMSDINPAGAVGDAASASAEHGELLLETAVQGLGELLLDMNRVEIAAAGLQV